MFERSWNVVIPANTAVGVVTIDELALPGGNPRLELEAWFGGLAGSNCYIFDGDLTAIEAANRIAAAGEFDCLLTVPKGGRACIGIPDNLAQRLTLYFDTLSAQNQAVTIRIKECRYELQGSGRY